MNGYADDLAAVIEALNLNDVTVVRLSRTGARRCSCRQTDCRNYTVQYTSEK